MTVKETILSDQNQLQKELKRLRLFRKFKDGKLSCEFCGRNITGSNIAALFDFGKRYASCCDNYECYKFFLGAYVRHVTKKDSTM